MTRPSPKTQKHRTMVKLLINTMKQYEDDASLETVAEGVADMLMDTVFFEADNGKLFWDHFYSIQTSNKNKRAEVVELKRQNKRLKVVNQKLKDKCLNLVEKVGNFSVQKETIQ